MQEGDQRRGESAVLLSTSFCWSLTRGYREAQTRISDCDRLSHSRGTATLRRAVFVGGTQAETEWRSQNPHSEESLCRLKPQTKIFSVRWFSAILYRFSLR